MILPARHHRTDKAKEDKPVNDGFCEERKQRSDAMRAVRRLRIISGQVEGLRKMVERQDYCMEILRQSLAIKAALSGFEEVVLRGHFYKHVTNQMKSGDSFRAAEELLEIFRLSKHK